MELKTRPLLTIDFKRLMVIRCPLPGFELPAFMCAVLDFDQRGRLQLSLTFTYYRHCFEGLCSPREKIITPLLWFVLILITLTDCRNACATALHFWIASRGQLRAAVLMVIADPPQSYHVDSGIDETGESGGAGPYASR